MEVAKIRLQYQIDLLNKDESYKARFEGLINKKVVKFPEFIKSIFYFLETDKEAICEESTQRLFWKKARHLWNADLIKKIECFQFQGPKTQTMPKYHVLEFIEKLLATVEPEDLAKYNASLGLIHKWMTLAIKYRKQNIGMRLNNSKKLREERETKIEEERLRQEDKVAKTEEAAEKFVADNKAEIEKYTEYKEACDEGNPPELEEDEDPPTMPEFDPKYFQFGYDEEHPPIVIPDEIIDDTDNDWVLDATQKEEQVIAYNEKAQEAIAAAAPPDPKAKK